MMREPPKHQQKLSHGRQPKKAPTKNVKAEEQRQDWNSGSRKKFAIFLYSFACCPLPSVSTNSSPSNSTVAPTVVAGSQGAEAVEATAQTIPKEKCASARDLKEAQCKPIPKRLPFNQLFRRPYQRSPGPLFFSSLTLNSPPCVCEWCWMMAAPKESLYSAGLAFERTLIRSLRPSLSLLLLHNGWMKKLSNNTREKFIFSLLFLHPDAIWPLSCEWWHEYITVTKCHKHVWVQLSKACGIWCALLLLMATFYAFTSKYFFLFCKHRQKSWWLLLLLRGSTKIHLVFNMIAAKMMLPKILLWQPFCILLVQPCRQYLYDNYKSYHCKAESRCFYHSYYAWKVACFFQNSVPFLRVEWNYILHFRSPYPVLLYLLWSLASTYNCK